METTENFWSDAEVISRYTRAEALADGVLEDISPLASEYGFKLPVAITAAVAHVLADMPDGWGEDITGRTWDMLTMLRLQIARNRDEQTLLFSFAIRRKACPHRLVTETLRADIHGGDNGEPVMTIGYSEDF